MLKKLDPEVYNILKKETEKQRRMLNLIASENYVSREVLQVVGCLFTNKYAEGYPGDRCYGGCQNVDSVEALAIERACRIFGAEHANVQPHAGSQANMGVYFAAIKPGDKILAMGLRSGGHLTHGKSVNFSGMLYRTSFYHVSRDTETIDYDEVRELARREKPDIICCGASSYSRTIDFSQFASIAREVNAYLMADIAHVAGLVAAGLHPSPVPHAEFVTTTTHKTLRGPRGGMILCRKEFAEKIDRAIFPGIQGGPLVHVVAAKAVAFKEAMTESFNAYQRQIVANAARLAKELTDRGYRLVSGGTDNHLMSMDLRGAGISGMDAEALLGKVGIIVNHNTIPYDPLPPKVTSGIRLGTPAVTTRGLKDDDMARIAGWIDRALKNRDSAAALKEIKNEVRRFAYDFPFHAQTETS